MAKKATRKAKKPTRARAGRVNTHKTNGAASTSVEVAPAAVSIGEAMRLAVEELGDVVIDEAMAPAHLRILAECYEQVAREQAAWNAKAEAAKVAKKALDGATALLLEKVRSFTHPAPLPLFDQGQATQDQDQMLAAAEG